MQNTINKPPLVKHFIEAASLVECDEDEDEDLYWFVDTLENRYDHSLKPKLRATRAFNLVEDCDLWSNLCTLKGNILVVKLVQVAPTLRKEFKEGATVIPKPHKPVMTAKIHATLLGDASPIKVVVEILYKVIPHTLIDGRSAINTMPFSTLEKLDSKMIGPSPYIVNMAN